MSYYVFGGSYEDFDSLDRKKQRCGDGRHFGLVNPGGTPNKLPYLWKTLEGASKGLCWHHAHLYKLSDDLTTVYLMKVSGEAGIPAPHTVILEYDLRKSVMDAVNSNNFYD